MQLYLVAVLHESVKNVPGYHFSYLHLIKQKHLDQVFPQVALAADTRHLEIMFLNHLASLRVVRTEEERASYMLAILKRLLTIT